MRIVTNDTRINRITMRLHRTIGRFQFTRSTFVYLHSIAIALCVDDTHVRMEMRMDVPVAGSLFIYNSILHGRT